MQLRTQLSGKIALENQGLFEFRANLIAAGIPVLFPEGDRIVGEVLGIPVTFDATARSLYETEVALFKAIRTSEFHSVYDLYATTEGYVGAAVGFEIAQAILANRPIIMLFSPRPTASVPVEVADLIEANRDAFAVERFDLLPAPDLRRACLEVAGRQPQYSVSRSERLRMLDLIAAHLATYLPTER